MDDMLFLLTHGGSSEVQRKGKSEMVILFELIQVVLSLLVD